MLLLPTKSIFVSSSLDKKLFVWNYTSSDEVIYNFTAGSSISKLAGIEIYSSFVIALANNDSLTGYS